MESADLYPLGPDTIPLDLTTPSRSYKKHAWLAMSGLTLFMLAYIALGVCFTGITVLGAIHLSEAFEVVRAFVTFCSGLLSLFIIKSLFSVRKASEPNGIEVTASNQPQLFEFIHTLADDVGAPRPHRVFLTPEVNAAVFYDLSLANLLFPSKKNLIIGLGLVNVLTLGELKAVLAHEFGHFAQKSMMVGRWVYTAQQIIGHMVVARDWLDKLIRGIGRIDIRIAWIGWILGLIIWSIRSVVDTLFRLVIIAERALSREMEFNADLVAVSVTGSDALINALHKLQAADHGWQTAISVLHSEASNGRRLSNIFQAQEAAMNKMKAVLDDPDYGVPPVPAAGSEASSHRVFNEAMARPPQMWSTHPANRDREDNAKALYVPAEIDPRSSWQLFTDPDALKKSISDDFYNPEKRSELEEIAEDDAMMRRFGRSYFNPTYRGNYLGRDALRHFTSIDELLTTGDIESDPLYALSKIYPESLKESLAAERSVNAEIRTLEGLHKGELQPSGGTIRHRGEELSKAEIPSALQQLAEERTALIETLKMHDALCHRSHLLAAEKIGNGWQEHLLHLLYLLHAVEHMAAVVSNERALLVNTWQVITADGKVGFFEKRRMIRTAVIVQTSMREVSSAFSQLKLPDTILETVGITNWDEQHPKFELTDVTKKNWDQWCQIADEHIGIIGRLLNYLAELLLEDVIVAEDKIATALKNNTDIGVAPPAQPPLTKYPTLMQGDEHQLQSKLDLWNRFQLAHGVAPTIARLTVAGAVIGGTIYGGFMVA